MSPFSQLSSALGSSHHIDHDFSPVLRFVDEFDRHFSHRHRFINCYVPRFDLEEDARFYYLYGEVPGAKVADINIEAQGTNTLTISGRTNRPNAAQLNNGQTQGTTEDQGQAKQPSEDGNTYVTVDASDAGKSAPGTQAPAPANVATYPEIDRRDPAPPVPRPSNVINVDVSDAEKPVHPQESKAAPPQHRVLLSERLVGDFHRTFTFPQNISDAGIKASIENGVLHLLIPKAEEGKKGRKISIVPGELGQLAL